MNILKGDIIFTKTLDTFDSIENGYIVFDDNKIIGTYKNLPDEFNTYEIKDYTGKLIIPGFVDLHAHAPQYENIGLGYDKQLLEWLNTYTFPEESKFADVDYAKKVYTKFVKHLISVGTTRIAVFASLHEKATEILFDLFIEHTLSGFIGKTNMDRNSPISLIENTEDSLLSTEKLIQKYLNNKYVKPIITPRFVPTCSDELMKQLGLLAKKYNIPIQSHISENPKEVSWVKELHPHNKHYADVYNQYGLFGQSPTVMAHCVYCTQEEIELMKQNNVFVAHCPDSNIDICSGIAPVKKYLNHGINVGLGSDISGGHNINMAKVLVSAIQSSKLYSLYVDKSVEYLTTSEAFYLATKGGGKFFGNVGSFEQGYEFDALIIDDSNLQSSFSRSIEERLQKFLYCSDNADIIGMYVKGNCIKG